MILITFPHYVQDQEEVVHLVLLHLNVHPDVVDAFVSDFLVSDLTLQQAVKLSREGRTDLVQQLRKNPPVVLVTY